MELAKAREIIRILADGVDPATGEVLPAESVYNSPEVIRALFAVLEATAPISTTQLDSHRNAGNPWTSTEDDMLKEEFTAKISISDIAKEHGRTYGAIESRLDHLGLKKKPFWLFGRKKKIKEYQKRSRRNISFVTFFTLVVLLIVI